MTIMRRILLACAVLGGCEDAEPERSPWDQQANAGPWSEGQGEPDTNESHEACLDLAECFSGCAAYGAAEAVCQSVSYAFDDSCYEDCWEQSGDEDHEPQAAKVAFYCEICPNGAECADSTM